MGVVDLAIADLHVDGADEHHWIHPIQRPGLPVDQLAQDPGGNRADRVFGDLDPLDLLQVGEDRAMGETLGRQRQPQPIDPTEAAPTFPDHRRFERALPIPGDVDLDRADIDEDRVGTRAVAGVPAAAAGGGPPRWTSISPSNAAASNTRFGKPPNSPLGPVNCTPSTLAQSAS